MGKRLFLLAFLPLLLVGCAGVQVMKVTPENANKAAFRFYHSYPYLLVTKNDKGLQGQTVYLPKVNEGYFINVKSGLGTVNSSFDLTDGWELTKFGDARDSKIPETINAVTSAASAASGIFKAAEVGGKALPAGEKILQSISSPGLYRYVFDEKDGFAKGVVAVYVLKEQEKNN